LYALLRCTAPDYSVFIFTPKKDIQEEFEDTKGVIRGRTPKKDIQKEIEDAKGLLRDRKPRRTWKKSLKIKTE
jgi:hypothetical protein